MARCVHTSIQHRLELQGKQFPFHSPTASSRLEGFGDVSTPTAMGKCLRRSSESWFRQTWWLDGCSGSDQMSMIREEFLKFMNYKKHNSQRVWHFSVSNSDVDSSLAQVIAWESPLQLTVSMKLVLIKVHHQGHGSKVLLREMVIPPWILRV